MENSIVGIPKLIGLVRNDLWRYKLFQFVSFENDGNEVPGISTLAGTKLNSFLNLCFEYSDCFTLQYLPYGLRSYSNVDHTMESVLRPFVKEVFLPSKWDGPVNSLEKIQNGMLTIIFRCETSKEALEALKKCMTDIFFQNKGSFGCFENICFFNGDRIIVDSTSHEGLLYVSPTDENFEKRLLTISNKWVKRDMDENQVLKNYYDLRWCREKE